MEGIKRKWLWGKRAAKNTNDQRWKALPRPTPAPKLSVGSSWLCPLTLPTRLSRKKALQILTESWAKSQCQSIPVAWSCLATSPPFWYIWYFCSNQTHGCHGCHGCHGSSSSTSLLFSLFSLFSSFIYQTLSDFIRLYSIRFWRFLMLYLSPWLSFFLSHILAEICET